MSGGYPFSHHGRSLSGELRAVISSWRTMVTLRHDVNVTKIAYCLDPYSFLFRGRVVNQFDKRFWVRFALAFFWDSFSSVFLCCLCCRSYWIWWIASCPALSSYRRGGFLVVGEWRCTKLSYLSGAVSMKFFKPSSKSRLAGGIGDHSLRCWSERNVYATSSSSFQEHVFGDFSRRLRVHRTDTNFPGVNVYPSNRCCFSRNPLFMCSPNRLSRAPF